jgi:hypothetical protein
MVQFQLNPPKPTAVLIWTSHATRAHDRQGQFDQQRQVAQQVGAIGVCRRDSGGDGEAESRHRDGN